MEVILNMAEVLELGSTEMRILAVHGDTDRVALQTFHDTQHAMNTELGFPGGAGMNQDRPGYQEKPTEAKCLVTLVVAPDGRQDARCELVIEDNWEGVLGLKAGDMVTVTVSRAIG